MIVILVIFLAIVALSMIQSVRIRRETNKRLNNIWNHQANTQSRTIRNPDGSITYESHTTWEPKEK